MKKIFLSVIITYLLTVNTLTAQDNKWHAGDFARVVSMCNTSNVLEVMADLMAEKTKEDDELADQVWYSALQLGECVFDGSYRYTVQLVEKLAVYPDLYGDKQNGELWQATVMGPTGRLVTVYVGLLESKASDGLMDQSLKPRIQS